MAGFIRYLNSKKADPVCESIGFIKCYRRVVVASLLLFFTVCFLFLGLVLVCTLLDYYVIMSNIAMDINKDLSFFLSFFLLERGYDRVATKEEKNLVSPRIEQFRLSSRLW